MIPILIIMNNYFHDLAAAFFLSSAIIIFIFVKSVERDGRNEVVDFFKNNYNKFIKILRFAAIWIIVGGIIRAVFFMKYEWLPAGGKGLIPAIIVKHILIFILIGLGIFMWKNLFKRIDRIIQENNL